MKKILMVIIAAVVLLGGGLAAYQNSDSVNAFRAALPLAEQGDAKAQAGLGFMYDTGRGTFQDHAEALKWYRKAAVQGHAAAQNFIGDSYGWASSAEDHAEALKWYRKAAVQGHAAAQASIADIYGEGRGVLQDNMKAHMWGNIASASGSGFLGRMYRDRAADRMTPASIEKAIRRAHVCMDSNYKNCD